MRGAVSRYSIDGGEYAKKKQGWEGGRVLCLQYTEQYKGMAGLKAIEVTGERDEELLMRRMDTLNA
jgi:hypothetical protein